MPAGSTAERRAMAIAEHHPEQLYARNRGLLKMSHSQLHDFASTKERGLPHYAPKKKSLRDRLAGLRSAGHFRTPRGAH
jgi:hypothetical protein